MSNFTDKEIDDWIDHLRFDGTGIGRAACQSFRELRAARAEVAAKDAEIERFRETIRNREQAELTALAELDEARAEVAAAVAREREECAKVAEQMPCNDPGSFGDGFSAACNEIECAIRSRPTPGAAKEDASRVL